MKTVRPTIATLASVLLFVCLHPIDTHATISFGTGPDSVYLVIEDDAFGPAPFVYEYRFTSPPLTLDSDQANLLTAAQLLQALVDTDPVGGDGQHFWSVDSTSFLGSLTLQIGAGTPVTLTADFFVDETSWWQWSAGGYSDTEYDGTPPFTENPDGIWSTGSGLEFSYLTPGSSIGLTFGKYNESFDPLVGPPSVIPEPGTALLWLTGLSICALIRPLRRAFPSSRG